MGKALHKKYVEVGLHVLFWCIYITYPIIKFGYYRALVYNPTEAIGNTLFMAVSVYVTYFLLSRKNRYWPNYVVILLVLIVIVSLNCYLNSQECECDLRTCFINKSAEYLLVNTFFIALLLIKRNMDHQRQLEQVEKEKVLAELKSLKAQLNPHFLFNTLNMLYSDAVHKDEILADKILKLSDSFHYLMHEGDKPTVTLSKEVKFIDDYIELQKARMGKKIAIKYHKNIENSELEVAPLLMIPFVENAFKHSTMTEGQQVPLSISVQEQNGILNLKVRNQFDPDYSKKQSEGWKESGIGLENAKKRLQLIYPNKHHLSIKQSEKTFLIHLEIELRD